jgi:hypothetical protein
MFVLRVASFGTVRWHYWTEQVRFVVAQGFLFLTSPLPGPKGSRYNVVVAQVSRCARRESGTATFPTPAMVHRRKSARQRRRRRNNNQQPTTNCLDDCIIIIIIIPNNGDCRRRHYQQKKTMTMKKRRSSRITTARSNRPWSLKT